MARIRSTVRSAFVLLFLLLPVGCAFALEATSGPNDEELAYLPPAPTNGAAVVRLEIRALLTTHTHSPAATYQQLGLQAGPLVQQFYAPHDYATYWIEEAGWNAQATQALHLLSQAADFGLSPRRYAWSSLVALPDSLRRAGNRAARYQQLALFELRLTDALLRYAQHLQRGQLQPHTVLPAPPPTDSLVARAAVTALHEALRAPDLGAALTRLQPSTRGYRLLQSAWARALHASPTDSARLMQDSLTGFRRVAVNLERLRWETPADSEYLVVNIPAYRLQLIKHGQVLRTHRVIVGKPEMPTPVLSSRIVVFVIAPEWRVPYSIAVREFLPELQRDPGYLYDNHYRLYDGRNRLINPWRVNWARVTPATFAYSIRQRAGSFNALGNVVFYFPNQQTVFLHDTPARAAFTRPERALSHGCVRVENPLKLADYLLRRDKKVQELEPMYASVRSHEKRRFDLTTGLPIYLRYYTCETDRGQLRFLPDIYHQDAALSAALFAD